MPVSVDPAAHSRAELVEMAADAGVTIGPRWTKSRIAAALPPALTAGDQLRAQIMRDPTDPDRELILRGDEAVVLDQAVAVADTIAELEAVLADRPLIVEGSKGQVAVHPAVAELRQHRAQLAVLIGRLDLPEPGAAAGEAARPWDHLTASQRARKAARARWDQRGA